MQEFFKQFFSSSSSARARLSVHLYAPKAGELDRKVVALLKNAGLHDVPSEQRQNLDFLRKYLKSSGKLSDAESATLVDEAKELGLKQMAADDTEEAARDGASVVHAATEITDVRQFRASLSVSSGPRAVKNLSEFEEIDAKL